MLSRLENEIYQVFVAYGVLLSGFIVDRMSSVRTALNTHQLSRGNVGQHCTKFVINWRIFTNIIKYYL